MKFTLHVNEAPMFIEYYHNINSYFSPAEAEFRTHPYFEIFVLLSGKAFFTIEDTSYTLNRGSLLTINNIEAHKHEFDASGNFESVQVLFSPEITDFLFPGQPNHLIHSFVCRPKGKRNVVALNQKSYEAMLKLINQIESISNNHSTFIETEIFTLLLQMLLLISRAFMSLSDRSDDVLPENVDKILKFIDSNLDSELSLKSLEERFYINRFYLAHIFKKTIGISLHKYIMQKRIARSKEYLSRGCNPVDVCSMVGFNNYSSFAKAFKRIENISPVQFTKSVEETKQILISDSSVHSYPKVDVLLPDIIITELFWTPSDPVECEPVQFFAVLKNIGNACTPNGAVLGVGFCVNGKTVSWSDGNLARLAPGQSITLGANGGIFGEYCWKGTAGSYEIVAYANDINRFKEISTDNNSFRKVIVIRPSSCLNNNKDIHDLCI